MNRQAFRRIARTALVAAALSATLAPSISFAQKGLYGGGNCSISKLIIGQWLGVYCGYL